MATVTVRLRGLVPRWMLSSDPHVSVNGAVPAALTKAPLVVEVPDGFFTVDVTVRESGQSGPKGRWSNPISHYEGSAHDGQRADLTFHPAYFSSYMRGGRLRRSSRDRTARPTSA